jgi:hypothetical protein
VNIETLLDGLLMGTVPFVAQLSYGGEDPGYDDVVGYDTSVAIVGKSIADVHIIAREHLKYNCKPKKAPR